MSKKEYKTFDLTTRRPKVLLMGNGLTYNTGISWHKLIQKVARDNVNIQDYEKTDGKGNFAGFHVPNTVLTLATSEWDDSARHKKYGEAFQKANYAPNKWVKALVEMPFDAILTTNYTYELESALMDKYPSLTAASKRNYARQTNDKGDAKYLIHTYNRLDEKKPDIWHIHGELRRPSSIILSHDEYARLIHHILTYNESRGADYEDFKDNLKFKSWIDYFLMGDVCILGLGMDFSDFDLWWLLGRRMRENACCGCGSIYFYEPKKEDNAYKLQALEDTGVKVRTCDVTIQSDSDYAKFYEAAIGLIKDQIK